MWILTLAVAAGAAQRLDQVLLLMGASVAAGLVRRRSGEAVLVAVAALACAAVGWRATVSARADETAVERVAASAGPALVALDGVVSGYPQTGLHGTSFEFHTRVGGRAVRLQVRAARFDIGYGDRYSLRARFVTPSANARSFLASRGLAGSVRVRSRDMVWRGRSGNPIVRECFWPMHRFARSRLSRALGNDSGLAIGMLLGERAQLGDSVRDAVRRLGITHLIAISGMHLTTVAGCVMLCTRPWPRWESGALVAAITTYTAMVGDVESLSRAYLMALTMIAMRAAMRPVRAIDALATTWFVMSVAEPLSLRSVGLQLSFAATFAVLVCLPRLHARTDVRGPRAARWMRRAVRSLAAAFVLSVAVELFIAPLQLHHFHALSAVGPMATVLFLVPVTLILLASAPVAVLCALAPAAEWPGHALGVLSTITTGSLVACGRLAPPLVALPEPRLWLYYGGLLLAWRSRGRWRRAAWALAAVLLALAFA